jgi:hypothetical protein
VSVAFSVMLSLWMFIWTAVISLALCTIPSSRKAIKQAKRMHKI